MARKIKAATLRDVMAVQRAIELLKEARGLLREADAPKAVNRVRLAISSAEGAERHVSARYQRTATE